MRKIFETRMYWPRIPLAPVAHKICIYENLVAFRTEKEMGTYHEKKCSSCPIYRKWKCPVCNGYHFLAKEMPGAGGSSGTQRENTIKLPRAEWEFKIKPQEPGTQFNVMVFTEQDRARFGKDASEEVVRRLEGYGVKIEWNKGLPITDERATLMFATTPIHYRRNEAGDMMYGWHEKVADLQPV